MKMGFSEKTVSRENDENLGDSELGEDKKNEEMGSRDFGKSPGTLNLDLSNLPDDRYSELEFQSEANFPEKQTENEEKDYSILNAEDNFRGMEISSGGEGEEESVSSTKRIRTRYSAEEKGKAKIENESSPTESEMEASLALLILLHEKTESHNTDSNLEKEEWNRRQRMLRDEKRRRYETAKDHSRRLANPQEDVSFKKEKEVVLDKVDEESQDLEDGAFCKAMEMVKKRNLVQDLKWMPAPKGTILKCCVPSLLHLSLKDLAMRAEAIASLELVPDFLRHKLSQIVSKIGKMDAHFLDLLVSGSPTEIRVNECSEITIDDFTRIFGACEKKNLTVLQLDLCGRILTENVFINTIATPDYGLPALATISLRGAYQLSDSGLGMLARSASMLQSVNLSQCSLLTYKGINLLTAYLKSNLRELYIDHCQINDAALMLPALKKLKCLEVLSVAGIETVNDYFVIEIVRAHGVNMKELVLANCVKLTDRGLKFVGKKCSTLCALDLSCLHNLTDSTMQYLADGCRSIRILKLSHNNFSDEAVAAFLEVSGDSLIELSLNHIRGVGLNTTLSLAKCSGNLLSLDLSWCRRITDEALGLVVDSCSSLRLLKLFGCTQITNVFLDGHSNSMVQIIGLKLTPTLEHLNMLEPQHTPWRY